MWFFERRCRTKQPLIVVLLAGAAAVQAAQVLHDAVPVLTVHTYPTALRRGQKAELVALSTGQKTLLVDAARTPELGTYLGQQDLLGAHDAKATAHALIDTFGICVPRWACATLSHALITAEVGAVVSVADLAQLYDLPKPPHGAGSLDAFAQEAQTVALIMQAQIKAIVRHGLRETSRIEAAAVSPVMLMEHYGMPIDRARLMACIDDDAQQMQNLCAQVSRVFGVLVGAAMDDAQLIAALARSKDAPLGLSEAQLSVLPPPKAEPLQRLVALRRLNRTVGSRFLKHIAADGRIHAHFGQIGARSGRMACTRPNLQAITANSARRACFRAPPNHVLVMGDYAACELRILAQMSRDRALMDAIATGADLHATIASRMFGTQVSREIRPDLRHTAKTIAFGLIYGMGPKALGAALQTALTEANALMAQFFGAFPKVQSFLIAMSEEGLKHGFVRTLSGRRCSLKDGRSDRAGLLRLARNLPIQGTSADIIKIALARAHARLQPIAGCQIVHCIHDEIVVVCHKTATNEVLRGLKEAMEGAGATLMPDVPLRADVHSQMDWQAH